MVRPRRCRRVFFEPRVTHFKPVGVVLRDINECVLTRDELEVIRLTDCEEIEQEKAGKKMKISQPTFSRLLKSARKKIAGALINGESIKIQGGDFTMVQPRGMGMRRMAGAGGRGRMGGGFAAGPGGVCKCPKCGYQKPQVRGQPCMNKKCPKCKTLMVRG